MPFLKVIISAYNEKLIIQAVSLHAMEALGGEEV
jgi:hypothetical protein